ncbi:MAG: AMP-dependent synthetase [Pseudonocardiales bacterium]|nr:AMP-dependent synthetase [Pseudonocardiales bacterium]
MFYPLTVKDFIDRAEQVYPDRIAVVDEPEQPAASWGEVTYRELARRCRSLAATLDRLEVPVGGRVAIVSHNSARMLAAFFGVSAYGRILVPVNFRLARAEIDFIVGHSGAEVLLFDPDLADIAAGINVKHRFQLGESDAELFDGPDEPRVWTGDEGATATLNYTSGTTARPKGVQLTHRNCWLNAVTFALHAGATDNDVYLHTLPMFHANGWGNPFAMTGLGVRHIVIRKIDGAEILRRVEQHGVTYLCAAPAVVNAVLDAAADWVGEIPGRDRVRIVVAGAPPPTITIERVREQLGWEFIHLYGLTETSPLVTLNRFRSEWTELDPHEQARLLVRQGPPAIGVRIAIGQNNEVLTASNHNLEGYYEQPDATADATHGGWFHTGDGGSIDKDGYLVIADRQKDVIITGGENVSSIEVEDILNSHPSVREVAVIGIPDEKWGELVTALVVTDGSAVTQAQLITHCRESLAGYKCPKRIEFRDELPRTATGKLQKFKLREPFWAGRDRQVN